MKKLRLLLFMFLIANNLFAQNAFKISKVEHPITGTNFYSIENQFKTNQQGLNIDITYYYDDDMSMENMSFYVTQKSRIFTRPIAQKIYKEGGQYEMSIVHKPTTFIFVDGTSFTTTCRYIASYDLDKARLETDNFTFDLDEDKEDKNKSAIFKKLGEVNLKGIQMFGARFNFVDLKSTKAVKALREAAGYKDASLQTIQIQPAPEPEKVINANGHRYVDLGLPSGTLWASCNIGAERPSEYGSCFSWAGTQAAVTFPYNKAKYCQCTIDDYKYYRDRSLFTKYVTDDEYGEVDDKDELELVDDAANVIWGGDWRMPTSDQFHELKLKCSWFWTSQSGHNGFRVTGPNGNSIFFPVAAIRSVGTHYMDEDGYYWTRSLHKSNNRNAACFNMYKFENSSYYAIQTQDRNKGMAIRAVLDKK